MYHIHTFWCNTCTRLYSCKKTLAISFPMVCLAVMKIDTLFGDSLSFFFIILLQNNCSDTSYLVVLLCSPYNLFKLSSMEWVFMLSCCLCNSLLVEASMIHLIVKLSFYYILYVAMSSSVAFSPTSSRLRISRI